jgi:GntR family transcriptional regulator/MocR family aminotransferase
MSVQRRIKLLDWARRAEAWIVEDDYDSEFRYDSSPISSLQGLDQHARVIYTSSFSKMLFPSLRIGYLVVPADLVERFSVVRQLIDLGPSHGTQAVLAAFIREGYFSRHIRKMRRLYEERRQVLMECIDRELAGLCTVVGANAGMHITLLLEGRVNDKEIASRAAAKGLIISPLSASALSHPARRQGLVLGFGNSPSPVLLKAVHQLRALLS